MRPRSSLWAALIVTLVGSDASSGMCFGAGAADDQGCVVCHGEAGLALDSGVHAAAGVSCTACHGGTGEAMDKELGHGDALRPLRDPVAAVELCGTCHADIERMRRFGLRTDPLELFWTSRHGAHLREGDGNGVATCVSCHGAHAVFRSGDSRSPVNKRNQSETCGSCHADPERMTAHGLSADGPALYRDSVHGRALIEEGRLSSPACSDCHGSHGATPPGFDEVGHVCGDCHTVVRDHFERGPHVAAVQSGALQECVSCHGYHDVIQPTAAMFRGEAAGHCGACHQDTDDPGRIQAEAMYAVLGNLDAAILQTEDALGQAAARGLFLEKEHDYLDEARGLRERASPMTHGLSPEALADLENRCLARIEQTHKGLADQERALRDRKIFTAILFVVLLLFVAVILIYRRETYGRAVPTAWRGEGKSEAANAPKNEGGSA